MVVTDAQFIKSIKEGDVSMKALRGVALVLSSMPLVLWFAGCGGNVFSWLESGKRSNDAKAALEQGNYNTAMQIYQDILKGNPNDIDALIGYAKASVGSIGVEAGQTIATIVEEAEDVENVRDAAWDLWSAVNADIRDTVGQAVPQEQQNQRIVEVLLAAARAVKRAIDSGADDDDTQLLYGVISGLASVSALIYAFDADNNGTIDEDELNPDTAWDNWTRPISFRDPVTGEQVTDEARNIIVGHAEAGITAVQRVLRPDDPEDRDVLDSLDELRKRLQEVYGLTEEQVEELIQKLRDLLGL